MKRSISMLLLLAGLVVVYTSSAADGDDTESDQAAIESALNACASSVASDASGNPDVQAMDECMSAKGFSRPMGGPPGRGEAGPDGQDAGPGGQGNRPPPPPPR